GELSKTLRDKTKTTLVAIAKKKTQEGKRDRWDMYPNPDDKDRLREGDIVILLGNDDQFEKVDAFLGTNQGR
ncbi:MAG: TrkA C-terminal domain-containing protein, partial [Thermoplasmata archaeon]